MILYAESNTHPFSSEPQQMHTITTMTVSFKMQTTSVLSVSDVTVKLHQDKSHNLWWIVINLNVIKHTVT